MNENRHDGAMNRTLELTIRSFLNDVEHLGVSPALPDDPVKLAELADIAGQCQDRLMDILSEITSARARCDGADQA